MEAQQHSKRSGGLFAVLYRGLRRLTGDSASSRRALSRALDAIGQGIIMVDASGQARIINARARALLELPDVSRGTLRRLAADRARALVAARGMATAPDGRFDVARADGSVIEVHSQPLANGGFVHCYTDVTEQRLADARLRTLAHHDALTGLANRCQLRQRVPQLLTRAMHQSELAALIVIDLDGFKAVNETFGHDFGDEVLVEVARRLQGLVREEDILVRLDGDEFVVLQSGLAETAGAEALAKRLLRQLAEPMLIGGQPLRIGASIGVALYPQDGVNADTLLKRADVALYCAKAAGRGTARFFDAPMTRAVTETRLLESGLRRAIENDEMQVHYQPKFACESLSVAGFEALARWRHPTRGLVSPETFIRIAEECGLIKRLGLWVIEQACRSAASWEPRQPVAVNVSPLQLDDGALPGQIATILARTGLPATMLEIEVTESVMADDNQVVLDTLHALKAMGVRVALDDFGTGYSSLGYLRRFSFDKIKIDKSFVQGQAHDQGVRVILEAILGMCHRLDLPVVGEGVETRQQLQMLRRCGCSEAQGYLLGRPMPPEDVDAFLETNVREQSRESSLAAAAREFELAPSMSGVT